MRPAIAVVPPLLIVAAVTVLSPATLRAADDGPAVPQNREAGERRRREALAWHRRMTVEVYDRIGKKDPKWDAAARKALEAWAVVQSSNARAGVDQQKVMIDAARQAAAAGCDDPLIQYLVARGGYGYQADKDPDRAEHRTAAAARIIAGDYPPHRRAHAYYNSAVAAYADFEITPEVRQETNRYLDLTLSLIPAILRDPSPSARASAFDLCERIMDVVKTVEGDRKPGFERVTAALEKAPGREAFRETVTGYFYVKYAWDARGYGFANTVTDEANKLFQSRLHKAEAALKRAWRLDPADPQICVQMLWVAVGRALPRETMELWFRRAMAIDGDCLAACAAKLDYLMPKWHGTEEDVLAFGRACVKTENYESDLPLVLVKGRQELADQAENRRAYLDREEVHRDLHEVMDGYLRRFPDSKYLRTMFAKDLLEAGDYKGAHEQFQKLGPDYWQPFFKSQREADTMIGLARQYTRQP